MLAQKMRPSEWLQQAQIMQYWTLLMGNAKLAAGAG